MAQKTELKIEDNLSKRLFEFQIKTGNVKTEGTVMHKAWAAAGLALLNFSANGSPKNPARPPILTGLLRGSGSVFIGSKFLESLPLNEGKGTPNRSHSEKPGVVTVGYNTSYAARMHENLTPMGNYNLGPGSQQSGDVKGGWLRSHLSTDGPLLMRLLANRLSKVK